MKKAKKTPGPIRIEAVIPIGIIILLLGLYFRFMFDANMRSLIAYFATQSHGAEVNVASFKSSFINPGVEIGKIEFTDKSQPSRNLFSVGKIKFNLLGDALLRAKLVIETAEVQGIEMYSPRKRAGKILPPPPPSNSKSTIRELEAEVLNQTQQKYEKNVLGDIASVLGGIDSKEQLKNIQEQLKSEVYIESLEKELKAKEEEWKKRIKELPKPKELDALVDKAKALKFSSKDPLQSIKNMRELDKLIKEADKKIDAYKDTQKDLKGEYASLDKSIKDIKNLVENDIEDLKKRFNIPDIDSAALSQSVFMGFLENKISGFRKYVAMAEAYAPKKKKPGEATEQLVPRPRGAGENIRYPITVGYPLFWLKNASVSSKAYPENTHSGDLSGSIKNISSSPKYINKPVEINLAGGFPYQGVEGIKLNWLSNLHVENINHTFLFNVASMQVGNVKLVDAKDIKLHMEESKAVLSFTGKVQDSSLQIDFENYFRQPKWNLEAKDKTLSRILNNVFNDLAFVSMYGSFTGSWSKLNMRISSNFGDEVVKGIKSQVSKEVDAARKEIENFVQNRIKDKKAAVESRLSGIKTEVEGELAEGRAKVDEKIAQAKNEAKQDGSASPAASIKDEAKDKAKEELKKGLKKLFN